MVTELEGEEYKRYWVYVLDTHIGFPHYKNRVGGRHIPIFVMKPL
jgi:hypothetical protein